MFKSALLVTAGIIVGAGVIQGLHAATGPAVYTVYEATVKDEAAYTAALPEVEKVLKEHGATRVAGGFNKAKLVDGKPSVGNRYVIIKWNNEEDFTKAQTGGVKAWIEKNAPEARQIMVESVEAK
jgi:uncharacterized protein (DUF1330 family)